MIKQIKPIVPFLLCLSLFILLFAPYASAAGTDPESPDEHSSRQPDYSRKGSVTLDILLSDGTPVPGGTLTAYLVGQAREDDGNNDFAYVAPFGPEGTVIDADTINNAEAGAPELAAALAAKAGSAGGKTVTVGNNGRAVFTNLTLGLYLIVQDTPAAGYEPIRSFLVTVPMWDGKALVYDVSANPKPSVTHELPTLDLPVVKTVVNQGGTPDPNEKFCFRLTPRTEGAPMPVNASVNEDGSVTVMRRGAGAVSFGSIAYGLDDVGRTYTYVVEELPGTNSKYTYDTRKYLVQVAVTMEGDAIKIQARYICSDNTLVTKMSFVNKYSNKVPWTPPIPSRPTTSWYLRLPQTGQRWWPVSVLAGLGLGLFLLGWWLRRKGAGNP